jgi:Holliday junction resolvase
MNTKAKGINAERDLIHKFWSTGTWVALRTAGSGSMRYPSPDILAGNKLRKIAIECKVTGEDKKYLTKDDIAQLKEFCDNFGAEPWIGVRLDGGSWHFLTLEDLDETEKGYVISSEIASRKGLLFEELIK